MIERKSMLRDFIARQFAAESLTDAMERLKQHLPTASESDLLNAALAPLMLPDLVDAIEGIILAADDSPNARAFAGGIMTYVYNPFDLIQDEGLAGWIDDTVVSGLGLRALESHYQIVLNERYRALYERAIQPMSFMHDDVKEAIENFIDGLVQSGASLSVAANPAG